MKKSAIVCPILIISLFGSIFPMIISPDGKFYASSQPALSVSISPSLIVMDVGQSTIFTSNVSGGTNPYSYQWYLNGTLVSGATGPTHTFAPSANGSVSVYLMVNDSATIPASAMSDTATVLVNPSMYYLTSPSASSSVINALHPSTVLTCGAVSGGTPPYTYQWYKMNPDLSYSVIPGATSSSYTFTPNDTANTPVWFFRVKVTDSAKAWVATEPVSVTTSQKVPAPEISFGNNTETSYGMAVGYPSSRDADLSSALNFSFSFNVRKFFDISDGLVVEYEGLAFSYVSGSWLCFQFRLMSGTNWNYPHIYINCSGDVIPIYLYNCSSFDMVTSNVTYVGDVPTFTNVITFHDIALQTYGHDDASSISLVFTQHFIADWTKLKIQTDTYADLTNMKLYYSNGSAVPSNTKFSLNFDYNVNLFNQSANFGPDHGAVEISPTSVTQTGLYFNVEGTEGIQYSLADMTLDDNYTELQGDTQIPNKTAIAYFSSISLFSLQKEQICSQRFTDLTYNVTTAVTSDPTISVMHNQVPFTELPEVAESQSSQPPGYIIYIIAIVAIIIVVTGSVFILKRRRAKHPT
jgi:hypothetical protein